MTIQREVGTRNMRLAGGRRVRVLDLLRAGLLEEGDELVFARPRSREIHRAGVTGKGRIRLADGQEFTTPSSAAQAAAGVAAIDGWIVWTVARTGEVLDAVRQRHLDQTRGVAAGDGDAGDQQVAPESHHAFLKAAREAAERDGAQQLTVLDLIKRWGSAARSATVDAVIEDDLANYGLTTTPDFRKVGLETLVILQLLGHVGPGGIAPTNSDEDAGSDRGLTVGNLPSALGGLVSVSPQCSFDEAITKMLLNDYSQLAVLASPFNLRGAITWRSITQARHDDREARITDAIVPIEPISYDTELIDILRKLYDDDFVFVKGPDNRIAGIVTAADVVLAYNDLSMPFLLVGQIDMLLRRLVARCLLFEDVASICDPEDARHLTDFDDLTIGDYQRALDTPSVWERLEWHIDRRTFISRLDEIRRLRNDITHFNPDPLPDDAMTTLRNFMMFLKHYVR